MTHYTPRAIIELIGKPPPVAPAPAAADPAAGTGAFLIAATCDHARNKGEAS